jgi:AcrR family transcriptional regulator
MPMPDGAREAGSATPESARMDRGARRRARTRAQLIDAGRTLFARQGIDATPINEITEQADVGFGSFYNHFESKDDIVAAVLREAIESQAVAVEALTSGVEDPAEVVAIAHRYFIRRARRDPDWGWLLLRFDLSHRVAFAALEPFAMHDLQRGLSSGRFSVADPTVALHGTGGALLAVMRLVLDGTVGEDVDVAHAEDVLRMLGLPAEDASEVARRPLPPLASDPAGERQRGA